MASCIAHKTPTCKAISHNLMATYLLCLLPPLLLSQLMPQQSIFAVLMLLLQAPPLPRLCHLQASQHMTDGYVGA